MSIYEIPGSNSEGEMDMGCESRRDNIEEKFILGFKNSLNVG